MKITGIIKDEKGQPLMGANICLAYFNGSILMEKGKMVCTSSDKNGKYVLNTPPANEDFDPKSFYLKVTFVGYQDYFINLEDWATDNVALNHNVTMNLSEGALDAVTVSVTNPNGTKTKKPNWKRIGTIGGVTVVVATIGILAYKNFK